MDEKKGWFLVVSILAIMMAIMLFFAWALYDMLQKTVSPVQSMTGELATQVSSVLNPTPTILPSPLTIIRDIRSLARLETIQFTVEKVITAEKNQENAISRLFGDKLIFVAHGNVIAGFDLSKLGADRIEIKDGMLFLSLPEPEVFVATLDNEKSYVYDRDRGLLTKGDIHLESAARAVAEDEIEAAAMEDGILELARQNGETFLSRLLKDLGYPEVIFVYPERPATPTPTP
ncbi:MAG: hypothetical protein B6D39_09855 [Anaerolineae bacterium UTCFX2]|jgi:hypothetical protein|nr:DUF4230 domain-containing protein [Anaerolineales bacterium]OQY89262.1 MAG: hypothetical protein B6D39_09855 [Anaerolineae bacterium UTCFX2]